MHVLTSTLTAVQHIPAGMHTLNALAVVFVAVVLAVGGWWADAGLQHTRAGMVVVVACIFVFYAMRSVAASRCARAHAHALRWLLALQNTSPTNGTVV